MCGIVGALDLRSKRTFPEKILTSMCNALTHRGPDEEGSHLEPGLGMASRRLSLVDIENGQQPMSTEDQSLWVSVNGELYDDETLRAELLARGVACKTKSDTELWLHLWRERQEGLFTKTRGQFAVALWDKDKQTLILGRDRIGICPLFIAEHDGWLLWASEIKALFASGLIKPEADLLGIDTVFSFRCAATKRTCFRGVRSLAPGHYLFVKDGQYIERRHSDVSFPEEGHERRGDISTLTDELEELLQRAVTRRLRGDVPVGSYLSGGLDSSTVLALAARAKEAPTTFTIGFDGAGFDERSWSSRAARAVGANEVIIPLRRADIAHEYPALIRAAEAPVIDTSTACLLRLAAEVRRRGYKVVLSGEGADEAMAGYVWYRIDKAMRLTDAFTKQRGASSARKLAFALIGGKSPQGGVLGDLRLPQHDIHDALMIARSSLYHKDIAQRVREHDPYADLDINVEQMRRWHPQHRAQYVDYKLLLPGLLLQAKGDRVSMNSGVEVRYPFLDDDVIDFCASLAPEYKLRNMTEKWLLRQVSKRVLPLELAQRTKRMFTADLSQVLLGKTRPLWVDQLLSPESLQKAAWFDAERVNKERRLQTTLPAITPRRLVMDATLTGVVATQLWHHLFFGGGLCDLPYLF